MYETRSQQIRQYFSNTLYDQYQVRFENLNAVRIQHFLLPVAVINFLLAVVPGLYSALTNPEFSFSANRNLLVIRLSLSLSLIFLHIAFPKKLGKKNPKRNTLLGKLFGAVILVHTMSISLADALIGSTVSSFLLGLCGILAALYWPPRRQLTFVGSAIMVYWALYYLVYQVPFLFLTQLTGQLLFAIVFFMLSHALLRSKADDFERMDSLEQQSLELKRSHDKLRRTEHALSSLKQHTKHGLFRLKRSQGFTYANEYLADMLGFTSPSELLKNPKSAGYIALNDLDAIAERVNQQGFVEGAELQITRRNGSTFWALVSCSIYTDSDATEVYYEGTVTDITYRKKALQDAISNATKLEQAEKIANTGFYELDLKLQTLTYSAGYCSILEIERAANITLKEHLTYVLPEYRKLVETTLTRSLSRQEDYKISYKVTTSKGKIRSVISRGKVLANEEGEHYLLLGTVLDVTQLHENKAALEKSEAIVRSAFNYNNSFSICILDTGLKVLEYNQEAGRRLVGCHGNTLSPGVAIESLMHPDTLAHFKPAMNKALEGESSVFVHQPKTLTDEVFWAEFVVGPVRNKRGAVIGVLIIAVDITERRRQEELLTNLSLVASHTDNAVMISDCKHRVEWVNEAFHRAFGYSLPTLQGQFPREFMVSDQTDSVTLSKLNNALRQGKSFSNEIQLKNARQEALWMQVTINPVYNQQGQVERFVSVYTDITQRKHFEDQLEEAKITAERSVEAKDHFLSTVSHELRTPLNGVIGLTYHLLQNAPRTDQQEDLQTLRFSAENLLSLINDILDLSKIEAGKVKLQQVPFNLKDIMRSITHSFSSQINSKGLTLTVNVSPRVPQELIGDNLRLTQILTNLLGNALKFTHKGGITITVDCRPQSPDFTLLQLEVADTGIGIAAEKLEAIFQKFEQANALPGNHYGGTGLGLAIVKQLTELQGGHIGVASTLGKGTTFSLEIPYSLNNKANLTQIALAHRPEPETTLEHLHILMAEDNVVNQAVAKKFLDSWGVTYEVAENGRQAVAMAKRTSFSLILMDLQMPEMDGLEATAQIRQLNETYRQLPIIAITAGGPANLTDTAQAAGLTDILLKPFTPTQLLSILKKYAAGQPSTQTSTSDAMPNNVTKTSGLDTSGLYAVAGGDAHFMQELLKLYVQQFTDLPTEIETAQLAQDRLQLRRIFHKLRPSVVMLKEKNLQSLGDEIHHSLHEAGQPFDQLSEKLDRYRQEMQRILVQLEALQQQPNLV